MGKKGWKKQKNTIADLKLHTRENGGTCLSTEFKTVKDIYSWQCKCGHQWHTSSSVILNGHWCPKCSLQTRKIS